MGTALAQGLRTSEGTNGKPTGEPASWLRTRCLQLPQPAILALTARSPSDLMLKSNRRFSAFVALISYFIAARNIRNVLHLQHRCIVLFVFKIKVPK